jgi:ammonium transporter, Amt family
MTTEAGMNIPLLIASAVLAMIASIAAGLFYGPLPRIAGSRARWLLGTAALVVVIWAIYGYGMAFGPALVPGFLGNPVSSYPELLARAAADRLGANLAFALFQATLVLLTLTLLGAGISGRLRFRPWLVFAAIWCTVVYLPLAYTVFNVQDGWLFTVLEVNDQAGGTVILISAGASVLAFLIVFRGQLIRAKQSIRISIIGALLLWVGWFGVTVGSETMIDGLFGALWLNTLVAPIAASLAWVLVETLRYGRPSARGAACGVVSGLVAITPACNILTPDWAIFLGVLAGALCSLAVSLKRRLAFDDGFDVVGISLIGGMLGMLYIGLFGTGIGWRDNGQPDRLIAQAEAALAVAGYAFVVTAVVAWIFRAVLRRRGSRSDADVPAVG